MGQEESTMQSTTTMTTASFAADPTPLEFENVRRMAYYGTWKVCGLRNCGFSCPRRGLGYLDRGARAISVGSLRG